VNANKIGSGKSFREERRFFFYSDVSMKAFHAGIYEKNLKRLNLLQKNTGYEMNITSLKQ
jgi:hypothetical protein